MNKHTYTAIITARGGSKGLPQKNIIDLAGKPLIKYTIDAAIKSQSFENIIVSTDCPKIKTVSLSSSITVVDRPDYLATDSASSIDTIAHALDIAGTHYSKTTHFILLQPTSPLRTKDDIKAAVEVFENSTAASLVSVVMNDHPIQKSLYSRNGIMEPVFQWEQLTQARQQLEATYLINGAIYISEWDYFLSKRNLFKQPLASYVMPKSSSIDIDNINDLEAAATLLKK